MDEKTRISLNIVNLIVLVGFIITSVFTAATWKTQQEAEDARLNSMIINEIAARKSTDEELKEAIQRIEPTMIDVQSRLAGIEEALEWLKKRWKESEN